MKTFQFNLRSIVRGWLPAACGMFVLMLIGAARVDGEHQTQTPEANVLEIPSTVELLRRDVPVSAEQAIAAATPRVLLMEITAYCPCKKCCGPGAMGLTASGKTVSYNDGVFAAADTDVLPFGTKLLIPGYASDNPTEVIDRGGAIKGNKLDVFFHDHDKALEWGRQWVAVTVVE